MTDSEWCRRMSRTTTRSLFIMQWMKLNRLNIPNSVPDDKRSNGSTYWWGEERVLWGWRLRAGPDAGSGVMVMMVVGRGQVPACEVGRRRRTWRGWAPLRTQSAALAVAAAAAGWGSRRQQTVSRHAPAANAIYTCSDTTTSTALQYRSTTQ